MTILANPAAERPRVRVRPAPPLEPPFDDSVSAGAGTPFDRALRGPRPQRPVTPRPARGPAGPPLLAPARTGPAEPAHPAGAERSAAQPAEPRRAWTPARHAAQRFLDICVEVLNGHRPVSQLRAVTSPAHAAGVTHQLVRRTPRTYLNRPGPATPPHRVRLRRLHVCEPCDGVAELAAVLEYGGRTWAMAARLQRHADTWLCTVLQVV